MPTTLIKIVKTAAGRFAVISEDTAPSVDNTPTTVAAAADVLKTLIAALPGTFKRVRMYVDTI